MGRLVLQVVAGIVIGACAGFLIVVLLFGGVTP